MHTISVLDGTGKWAEHTFPGKWEELTRPQFVKAARVLGTNAAAMPVRIALLSALSGIPIETLLKAHPRDYISEPTAEQLAAIERPWWDIATKGEALADEEKKKPRLLPQLDAFFEEPCFTESRMPTVALGRTVWTGPANALENFTLNRFVWCEVLYKAFATGPGEVALHTFLAALYQPSYATWSNLPIEEYAARLAKLPTTTKVAAMLNYRGLRTSIARQYPITHERSADDDQSPTSQGMFGMIIEATKTGVFGDKRSAENYPLHEVLAVTEHELELDRRRASKNKKTLEPADA